MAFADILKHGKKRFKINPNCMAIDKAVRFLALPPECKYYGVKV